MNRESTSFILTYLWWLCSIVKHNYLARDAAEKNEILSYFADGTELHNSKINWKPLSKFEDKIKEFCTIGDKLFLLTHKNAPNYKIGITDIKNIDYLNAKIIVPESEDLIRNIQKSKNYFFYSLSNWNKPI